MRLGQKNVWKLKALKMRVKKKANEQFERKTNQDVNENRNCCEEHRVKWMVERLKIVTR